MALLPFAGHIMANSFDLYDKLALAGGFTVVSLIWGIFMWRHRKD